MRGSIQLLCQCLGGKIEFMMTYAGTPVEQHVPAEWRNKILHATLAVGDQILQGADGPPETYKEPQGFSVSLNLKDPAKAERIFHTLAEKGNVRMATREDLPGCSLWHACRSVRRTVDDQLWPSGLMGPTQS
jgi:PhnB protein